MRETIVFFVEGGGGGGRGVQFSESSIKNTFCFALDLQNTFGFAIDVQNRIEFHEGNTKYIGFCDRITNPHLILR